VLSTRWLQKRRPYWARVDELVARSEKSGIRTLNHHELRELALLYRQAASDLSTVREDPSSQRLAESLNQLLGRAHNCIYMGRRRQASRIVEFYRDTSRKYFTKRCPIPSRHAPFSSRWLWPDSQWRFSILDFNATSWAPR
jgi:hypothetical protein